MTPDTWIALIALFFVTLGSVGASVAYVLRAVDQAERRVHTQVMMVFARQEDLARLEERVSAIKPHLERIEGKLDRLLD